MSFAEFLPHPDLEKLAPDLLRRLEERAGALLPEEFMRFMDPDMTAAFQDALHHISASEGTVWILDVEQEALVPVFNNGPKAAEFVGQYRQPLSRGIISMVFHTQIGSCELDVYKNSAHDPKANEKLQVVTCSMVAVPFFFAGNVRGILSAVKLRPIDDPPENDPPPFEPSSLGRLNTAAALLGSVVEAKLIKSMFGIR